MSPPILPILAMFVSVVIFFGYTKPLYDVSVREHEMEIDAAKKALAAAAGYVERANELAVAEAAMDQEALGRLKIMLPDSVNNVRTILDLDALAVRSGIALSSVDVSETSAEKVSEDDDSAGPLASVELSISGRGTYAALQKFLEGIEKSQRLLDVTHISVASSETGVYTYTLTARLYWLR